MPDSAQIEQELQQRQGVAKEDTLPPVENKDLQYVPTTQQVLYSPPKVPFSQKYLVPVWNVLKLFIPEVIIFTVFILIFAYALNYFNFIPLSTMYPKYFSILPHRYDGEGNTKKLSDIKYSSDLDGYRMQATFYKADTERISVLHKGKYVELLRGPELSCNTQTTKKISQTETETLDNPAFCSDVLSDKSNGKKVDITFKRSSDKSNLVNYIIILQ